MIWETAKKLTEDPALLLTAWATIGAAIATFLSAVFIAFQAIWTRRSVKETASALEIAQREFEQNSQVFADAQKGRIDAEMPRLTVLAPTWFSPSNGRDSVALKLGTRFTATDDPEQELNLRVGMTMRNDGPRLAQIDVSWVAGRYFGHQKKIVRVGDSEEVAILRTETLGKWMELAELYTEATASGGVREPTIIAEFYYISPGDTGANELHTVVMRGSLLRTFDGREFEVGPTADGDETTLTIDVQPFTRTYWQSRREGRSL